jgi:hypothetical protein
LTSHCRVAFAANGAYRGAGGVATVTPEPNERVRDVFEIELPE